MLELATLEQIVSTIEHQLLNPLIVFLSVLASLIFIWGILEFVANAGNAEAQETGRRHIVWGLAGLIIMVSAFGIINLIASIYR